MNKHRLVSLIVMAAMVITSLLPAAGVVAAPLRSPAQVNVAGSFEESIGGSNWSNNDPLTDMADANSDGVWKFAATPAAGDYEYKIVENGDWGTSFPAENVAFTADGSEVTWRYDENDHFVSDTTRHVVATAVGNFAGAIGGADWSPDNLKTWMKDLDDDGVYTFSAAIPAGDYEYKVALNESWDVSFPASGNVAFSVPAGGAGVTFYYDGASNEVWEEISGAVPDEELVAEPVQHPIQDEVMYFVLPDRFDNGDPSNDEGAFPGGTLAQTGFLPEDKSFYHGGDLAGLQGKLDYIAGLGVTSIWVTPVLANKPTQSDSSTAFGIGGSYHGYWILDYETADPHLGSDAGLQAFIDEAHTAGIKVFFDIVVNHTADVIDYTEGTNLYRNKTDYPFRDADGVAFDDLDYVGTGTFPELDANVSFPYTPYFPDPDYGDDAKNPAWLNDPIYYHNRGDSTFSGESSIYGDFFGLDDLFTSHPVVIDGFTEIFKNLIDAYDIDGFRLDTVKHVHIELWQELAPAVLAYAETQGKPDFLMFGEVFDGSAAAMSTFTTAGKLQSVLDFGLHGTVANVGVNNGPTHNLRNLFAADDYFTDADSNAYQLATFISNHDIGRAGYALRNAFPAASDAELVQRMTWGYAMLFFARGFPVVYYGDEQGFVGGGSDKLSREDMMPSLVPEYMNNDLIGTDATPADANFDTTHPLYQALAELAQVRADHVALRRGAQIHRYSTDGPGVYAFSRIERDEQIEYVVAFNSANANASATFPVYLADTEYMAVYPAGGAALTSSAGGELTVTLPAGGVAVYKAAEALPPSPAAPAVTFNTPAAGAEVIGRVEVGVGLSTGQLAEVTFVVKVGAGDWELVGVDTNAPYRVFYDASALAPGTALTFRAIANDLNEHLNGASLSVVVGAPPAPAGPKYALIHYFRTDGDYGDPTSSNFNDFWGLHLWGDGVASSAQTQWTQPMRFFGEDDYGVWAWVELGDATQPVNFIVHRGDTKDPPNSPDRFFNALQSPRIWLKQNDVAIYTSQADAQGYVTIRYHRPDGNYGDYTSSNFEDFWGLHLWTSLGGLTEWTQPKRADGIDDYGAYFILNEADYPGVLDFSLPINFIVHRGNDKDPVDSPDRSFEPSKNATIWLQSGDVAVYNQRGAAEDFALLHYRRPAGDYGDPTSANFGDFWGMHLWGDTTNSVQWTDPLRPIGEDTFGITFKVDLTATALQIGYIFHRGDEKDPGPDQFLSFDDKGYEVWQLQGADPEDPYVRPVPQASGGNAGNLQEQRAYWVLDDTIAWSAAENAANDYMLCYAPDGGLEATANGVTGGDCIDLTLDPAGLPQDVREKMPHIANLPALKISADDLAMVPDMLKGQVAVSALDAGGTAQGATGLQIQGVLDDLFTYNGPLGVSWDSGTPTINVWAPTAKTVTFHLFADSDPATTSATTPMAYDADSGVWSITGQPGWEWQYYLFEVEVWVNSTQRVERNVVTDPYSLSLAMDSTRSQIVDLADPALKPAGWDSLAKPALAAPEDLSIYEIHVRDFSVNDPTVPDEMKGTFKAFTLPDSNGVRHLQALQAAGLSLLHLLPTMDIATINENKAEWQAPTFDELAVFGPASQEQQALLEPTIDLDAFNWGYDPWHFTVPEGSYSTDPDGPQRIVEFREMVQALNDMGLRVAIDVVYNHTNAAGQSDKSVLDRIVPGYYHRMNDRGQIETSTCCQNTASEFNMMEKLMIESVLTWAVDYKVDSFRFDLMGHHMKRNMLALRDELDALTMTGDGVDGEKIYVYGEGWNFGEVADNARGENATQFNMAGTGIGTFSDRLRDAVRGGGPFDGGQDLIRRQGWANGLYYDPNALNSGSPAELQTLLHSTDLTKLGMAGNLADYQLVNKDGNLVTGSQLDYNGQPAGYTEDPQEQIIYISKHDNQTLYDINAYKMPVPRTTEERVRAQIVGLSTVVLGQGVPFLHAGVDLLRSKSLDRNSYNSGDWFNRLDWTYQESVWGSGLPRAADNQDNWPLMQPLLANPALNPAPADIAMTTAMLQELLALRYSSPLFRLQTEQEVMERVSFLNNGPDQLPGLIVMALSDMVEPDLDPDREWVVVLANANDEAQTFSDASFAGAALALHPIQANGVDPLVKTSAFDPATGAFSVPGRTTAVFTNPQLLEGVVTQTASTSPVVPGTYIDVDVSVTNNTPDDIMDFLALAPIDPDTVYVMGSASGGAMPLTAVEAAQMAAEKGLPELAAKAAGRAPEDVVAVAWMGTLAVGETVDFGFQVRVMTSSGEVRHDVALFDGATFVTSLASDALSIVDNSAYPVSRSRRFNVDRDTFINGAQPAAFYGSSQTMWTGFFSQMRPLVHTPMSGIPGDAYVDVAYLYLYVVEGRGFTNWSNSVINVEAHPVTTQWMPDAANWWTPWTMPGGDYGPAVGANHIGSGKLNTWLRLDVTEAVADRLRGGPDQGFIITNTDTTGVRYALATKEYFDASKLGYIRVYFRTAN